MDETEGAKPPLLKQVASSQAGNNVEVKFTGARSGSEECTGTFRQAQWSPDGTCILTHGGEGRGSLKTVILPPDLLTNESNQELSSYSSSETAESVSSTAPYPFFTLSEPSSTLILCGTKDHPIHLLNSLNLQHGPIASYPLINNYTEAYVTPASMAFTRDGQHFITGSDSLVCAFDVGRQGDGPVERHQTIPSKKAIKAAGGAGIRGILSTMSISNDGTLAVGSFSRMVGLYAHEGRGECEMFFELGRTNKDTASRVDGTGITQITWSPCSRYLYVAERKSDAISVFDIRGAGAKLATLHGRKAVTNQRLTFSMIASNESGGHEIWAGGTDGGVRVWKNPHHTHGEIDPWCEFDSHIDPIVASLVHPSGTVVATCANPDRYTIPTRAVLEHETFQSSSSASSSSSSSSPISEYESWSDSSSGEFVRVRDSLLKVWSIQRCR